MEWIAGIAILIATAAIAYTLGKNRAPSQRKIDQLENLVLEKDTELQQYRQKVTNHFEKTADLFNKVTQDYQSLYQYMAQSSDLLADAQPFKNALEHNYAAPQTTNIEFKGEETFSSEQFYHAHDYRNQSEASPEVEESSEEPAAEVSEQPKEKSADIIQLDQSNETPDQRPLDYAVKPKGVINHNSLNMDDVKT